MVTLADVDQMIRTFAIWKRSWWVIIPLTILSLCQWAILFHGTQFQLEYSSKSAHNSCLKVLQSSRYLTRMLRPACSFLLVTKRTCGLIFNISSVCSPPLQEYTPCVLILESLAMGFDLTVLVLSTIGLLLMPGRTSLWKFLFRDGIAYFLIAFSANLLVAVFLLLDLNPIMNVMFSLPAACITASAATRSFIRLNTHLTSNAYI
jgi:hypothetical protein